MQTLRKTVARLMYLSGALALVLSCDSRAAAEEKTSAERGRDVFRFETFGNEGFWTDAMRLSVRDDLLARPHPGEPAAA